MSARKKIPAEINRKKIGKLPISELSLPHKHYLRIDEVAYIFRRSNKTIRRWIAAGDLDAHRLKSGGLLIPSSAVRAVVRLDRRCYEKE